MSATAVQTGIDYLLQARQHAFVRARDARHTVMKAAALTLRDTVSQLMHVEDDGGLSAVERNATSRATAASQRALKTLPDATSQLLMMRNTYVVDEQRWARQLLAQEPALAMAVQDQLGLRPSDADSKAFARWNDGVTALLVEQRRSYMTNDDFELGVTLVNARRIRRAQHATQTPSEEVLKPEFGLIQRPDPLQRIAMLPFVATHEPGAVVDHLGRPEETFEDLALWAPAAVSWLENLALLGEPKIAESMALTGAAWTEPEFRALAQLTAEWQWWKAAPEGLGDFHSPFDMAFAPAPELAHSTPSL